MSTKQEITAASYPLASICAACGKTWGAHRRDDCLNGRSRFVLLVGARAESAPPLPTFRQLPDGSREAVLLPLSPKPEKSFGEILREMKALYGIAPTPASERLRSPLPYFAEQQERARFDKFRDLSVTSSSSDPNHYRGSFGSPDLQKAEHQVSPMFGSAFLRG